jgi:hypothetical protein
MGEREKGSEVGRRGRLRVCDAASPNPHVRTFTPSNSGSGGAKLPALAVGASPASLSSPASGQWVGAISRRARARQYKGMAARYELAGGGGSGPHRRRRRASSIPAGASRPPPPPGTSAASRPSPHRTDRRHTHSPGEAAEVSDERGMQEKMCGARAEAEGPGAHLDDLGGHEIWVAYNAVQELLERDAAALDEALLEARSEEIHCRLVWERGDEVAREHLGELCGCHVSRRAHRESFCCIT